MASGLNKVMLIGRVGRAPETRFTPAGLAVTSFGLGVPRQWQSADGEQHRTVDWFNVVAWGDLAERCSAELAANSQAFVEGRLQVRNWEDAEGRRHALTEIVASQALSLGPGGSSATHEDD